MNSHCATLLLFVALAGVSAASNLSEDQQIVDRRDYGPGCSPCAGISCKYGGICNVYGDRPVCFCANNYVGHVCSIKLDHTCKTHSCLFLKSFEHGRGLGQWTLHETHYPSSNQLIANVPQNGKAVLTTGQIYWGNKKHNLFFRVKFYNPVYHATPRYDKILVILERPYGEPEVLRTLNSSDFTNHLVSNEFCIGLPKTGNPKFAISFKIICGSKKCGKAIEHSDITEISLLGITIQESTAECSH